MSWDKLYIDKLKRYDFGNMLKEPTYGENIIRGKLSQGAYELITEWKRDIFFNNDFLKDYFQLRNMPIYEKVINFFSVYGGRTFCYEDYHLSNDTIQIRGGYTVQSFPERVEEKDGKIFYSCMNYHYAGDWGPHIDQDGRVYSFSMGKYYKQADDMAEFMEQEWNRAVRNRKNLEHIINGTEKRKYYFCNSNTSRKENIWQNVYEYLISCYSSETVKMLEPLMWFILHKKIFLSDEKVNQLMEVILENQRLSEELVMDILEFLSNGGNSSKTILTMIDVVNKITLEERKEQFLIDKLIQWEDDYPVVRNRILSLL